MIGQLEISGFKSIEKVSMEFKQLNIICGENASGKTSIIHAILLCSQNEKDGNSLDGKIIKIGDYDELKNKNNSSAIEITLKNGETKKTIICNENDDILSNFKYKITIIGGQNAFKFEDSIFYLCSNRVGVVDTYAKGDFLFGNDGAETISFLYKNQDSFMNNDYMESFKKEYSESNIIENKKFIEHVRFWIEKLSDEDIYIDSIRNTNQFSLCFGNQFKIRPINTGSGYSYLLPIVVTCLGIILLNKKNATIIIENPEIFLHPRAQLKLMHFLSFCKNFMQIILETHSEYIVKGALDNNKNDTSVYVVAKNKYGFTETTLFDSNDFKTDSYLEVLYRAFGIATNDFHNLLYGILNSKIVKIKKIKKNSIIAFDKYLYKIKGVRKKVWKHKKKTYRTLPTFIRNKIDHPDGYGNFSYDELVSSIDFLLKQL